MAYHLLIEILDLPKTRNQLQRKHWTVQHKEAKKWKMLVGLGIGPNKPPAPLTKANITLTRFGSREPDFDGLTSSFKAILDGLTEHGIILDDKPSIIGSPTYNFVKAKRKDGKIRIEVTEQNQT